MFKIPKVCFEILFYINDGNQSFSPSLMQWPIISVRVLNESLTHFISDVHGIVLEFRQRSYLFKQWCCMSTSLVVFFVFTVSWMVVLETPSKFDYTISFFFFFPPVFIWSSYRPMYSQLFHLLCCPCRKYQGLFWSIHYLAPPLKLCYESPGLSGIQENRTSVRIIFRLVLSRILLSNDDTDMLKPLHYFQLLSLILVLFGSFMSVSFIFLVLISIP